MANNAAIVFVSVLNLYSLSTGEAKSDVYLRCPDFLDNGRLVTLTCFVNATRASPEVCTTQLSDIVDFQFNRPGAPPSSECTVQNFRTSCHTDPSSSSWCDYLRDGAYVLKYDLVPDESRYGGGSFSCQVPCLGDGGSHPLTRSASPGCSVRFGFRYTGSAVGTFSSRSVMMVLLIAVWLVNGIHVFPAKQ